jgi:hypothetical protein
MNPPTGIGVAPYCEMFGEPRQERATAGNCALVPLRTPALAVPSVVKTSNVTGLLGEASRLTVKVNGVSPLSPSSSSTVAMVGGHVDDERG